MLKNSQPMKFIFETLTQRFLHNVLRYFQFVGKSEYCRYSSQYYTQIEEAVVKKRAPQRKAWIMLKNSQLIDLFSKLCH